MTGESILRDEARLRSEPHPPSEPFRTIVGDSPLVEDVLSEMRLAPENEAYSIARRGVQTFLAEMLAPKRRDQRIDKAAVDLLISEIDRRIAAQVDAILHQPAFQELESTWRSLKYVVEQVDFRENTQLDILSCSKDDLIDDFEDAPEVVKSGLYRRVYSDEYGTFGGQPYGLMFATFDVGPGPRDMNLLRSVASVAAMAHVPFVGNASPEFFGESSHVGLPRLKDLQSLFEGPQYARWHAFRESEDARYVGLALPRILMRLPYGHRTTPVRSFAFEENCVGVHSAYLWGPASTAFAACVARSFAKYRWCPNIIGPRAGGSVHELPLHHYDALGALETKIPTEIQLTERREYELSEQGFIGLTFRKDSNCAAFFSANSAQKPKYFGNSPEGKAAETNYRLGTQLPYFMVITRLSHYLKVLQREQIGTWKERGHLERELNQWISQYVADMESPAPEVRSRRPLREARVTVTDIEGQPGWYAVELKVRPHFKYMGATFELSLVGRMEAN